MDLKSLRTVNKVRQKEVANVLKVSRIAVANYETGKREPSIAVLPKLAKILNCTIEELVMAIIETKQNNSEKRAV